MNGGAARRLPAVLAGCVLAGALALAPDPAAAAAPADEFGSAGRQALRSLGPWPPPPPRDPGNAASGRPGAIAYGRALFADPGLSGDGTMSCAHCHDAALAFSDGLPRAMGRERLPRRTPSLWNSGLQRWQGWDGAADSLWSQALRPMVDPREMAATPALVAAHVRADPARARRHARVFGGRVPGDDERVYVEVGKALGAYMASLVSPRTPFDDFRDALLRGDAARMARYPDDARRGLALFVGRGRCIVCHAGPLLSNGEFADTGLPHFVAPGVVDSGRHGGLAALRDSRYTLLSRFAQAPGEAALATRHVQPQHRNFGEFKVPSLRGVADRPPYMHDGQLATLQDVVRHYSQLDLERLHADGEQILQPLHLDERESADLVAFLRSLSPAPDTPATASARGKRAAR